MQNAGEQKIQSLFAAATATLSIDEWNRREPVRHERMTQAVRPSTPFQMIDEPEVVKMDLP